jgi:ubiquinone/menaquinone biosynthesis C-methylase UbiE
MQESEDPIAITQHAYERIAASYAALHATLTDGSGFWRTCMERFADVVRANADYQARPELPVVDIGCGPGRDALQLAQRGFHVVATDLSDAMLDEARKRCEGQPSAEHVTFRRMDMRALDFADASCAGLWVSASFLHIPKSENQHVLREFRRVLVSGGALTLLVKERDAGPEERYEVHQPSGEQRFFARYRGSELWDLLEQAGFMMLELRTARDARFTNLQRWLGALAVV